MYNSLKNDANNGNLNFYELGDLIPETVYASIPVNVTSIKKVWGKETASVVFYMSRQEEMPATCVRIVITFNQTGKNAINSMQVPWADGSIQTLGTNQLWKTTL